MPWTPYWVAMARARSMGSLDVSEHVKKVSQRRDPSNDDIEVVKCTMSLDTFRNHPGPSHRHLGLE
jgi:hypothetical protein